MILIIFSFTFYYLYFFPGQVSVTIFTYFSCRHLPYTCVLYVCIQTHTHTHTHITSLCTGIQILYQKCLVNIFSPVFSCLLPFFPFVCVLCLECQSSWSMQWNLWSCRFSSVSFIVYYFQFLCRQGEWLFFKVSICVYLHFTVYVL